MNEEPRLFTNLSERFLRSHITLDHQNGSSFELVDGPSTRREYFRERFLQAATDAGLLLGAGVWDESATPATRWIERLFTHHKGTPRFVVAPSDSGGIVTNICEASAVFCTWLDRHNQEKQALGSTEFFAHTLREATRRNNRKLESAPEAESVSANARPVEPAPDPKAGTLAGMLRAYVVALDEQDSIILERLKSSPAYAIPETHREAIAGVFNQMRDLIRVPAHFDADPFALRAQIREARAALNRAIEQISSDPASIVAITNTSPSAPSSNPSLAAQMDKYVAENEVSHEELAARMHIPRSTYFRVKEGRGGKRTRAKIRKFFDDQQATKPVSL